MPRARLQSSLVLKCVMQLASTPVLDPLGQAWTTTSALEPAPATCMSCLVITKPSLIPDSLLESPALPHTSINETPALPLPAGLLLLLRYRPPTRRTARYSRMSCMRCRSSSAPGSLSASPSGHTPCSTSPTTSPTCWPHRSRGGGCCRGSCMRDEGHSDVCAWGVGYDDNI